MAVTHKPRARTPGRRRDLAPAFAAGVFAALGDETRLSLVAKLAGGEPRSISQLADGSAITRQAVTKHLRVLESVGIVRSLRAGRENLFELDPEPIEDLQTYLNQVWQAWDQAIVRLKNFVEE